MKEYRLFFLSDSGRLARAIQLLCAGDDEAISRSEELRQGSQAELWELGRAVRSFRRQIPAEPGFGAPPPRGREAPPIEVSSRP